MAVKDPYFDSVTGLYRLDGNGSDASSYARTATITGCTYSAGVFSNCLNTGTTGSAQFTCSNGSGVSFNQDFTIEFWAKRSSGRALFTTDPTAPLAAGSIGVYFDSSINLRIYYNGTSLTAVSGIATTSWNHYAITRSGNTIRVFVGGVLKVTYTFGTTPTITNHYAKFADYNYSGAVEYIDEFRFTAGVARYTATFTPPSAPFPGKTIDLSGTVTLNGVPVSRSVLICDATTHAVIDTVTSDATTGAWAYTADAAVYAACFGNSGENSLIYGPYAP